MMQLSFAILSAALFFLAVAVRRVYYCVPAKELKRLARQNDRVGVALYKAVAFDSSLAVLLWFVAGVFATLSCVLLMAVLPTMIAGVAIALVLWLGFGWLATSFPRGSMVQLTVVVSPVIAWLLTHMHTVLFPVGNFMRRHHRVLTHTGVYEKQDLTELFAQQKEQLDSRVAPEEIELMERVLAFGDKTVHEVLTGRHKVQLVRLDETIGPKLMDELHKSGQQLFPVADESGRHIVGIVRLADLVKARHGGVIRSVADEAVYFAREDFSLQHALDIFRQTKQQLLIVINKFEEFLGVVTLDNLLQEVMGASDSEAENIYADRTAVAQYEPPELPEETLQPGDALDTEQPSSEATETANSELPNPAHDADEATSDKENTPPEGPEVVE